MKPADPDIAVSLIVPTYNGRDLLAVCLPALRRAVERSGLGAGAEILVVDDASTDGTRDELRHRWPEVRTVRLEGNVGFAAAANAGIRASRGRWVGMVNNDVTVAEDWLAAALVHFDEPGVGAIATRILRGGDPPLVESDGDEYTVAGVPLQGGRDTPPAPVHTAEAPPVARTPDETPPHVSRGNRNTETPRGLVSPCGAPRPSTSSRRCFSGCGAAAFYRRQALADTGAFYEDLQAYYEDVELGFRLNLRGWRCIHEPRSVCVHRGSASYGRGSFRQKFNSARNAETIFFTCMPRGLLLRYLPAHVLADVLLAGHHVLRGTGGAYLRGKLAFLSFLGSAVRRRREVQRLGRVSAADLRECLVRPWLGALLAQHRRSRTAPTPAPHPEKRLN